MNAQRELAAMQHINAGDFAKIIAALLLCAAKAEDEAPEHHKGVYISLRGHSVLFSAIRYGQTTEVELVGDTHQAEERHYFLDFKEVEQLQFILAHDANAPVSFFASRQPITHGECLLVTVDDWWTGYTGSMRPVKNPFRTRPTRTRSAAARDLATVYANLSALSERAPYGNFKIDQHNPARETVITVVHPLPGLYSAKSYLY